MRAPQVQRRDRRNSQLTTAVGTGGDFHRQLARSAAGLTAQLSGLEDRQTRARSAAEAKAEAKRVREAKAQGQQDGLNPNLGVLTLQESETPEGRAYNAAASRTYMARLEVNARQSLDGIAQQYSHDPAMMAEKIQVFQGGYGSAIPETLKGEMDLMMSQLTGPYLSEAGRLHRQSVQANDKAAFIDQWAQRSQDISRKAYLSDGTPETDASLAGDLDGLKSLLIQHGPKQAFTLGGVTYSPDAARSGVMDAESIVESLQDVGADMRTGKVLGQFSRLETERDQAAFMADFETDYAAGTSEIGKFTPSEYQKIVNGMRKTVAGHVVARKKRASEAKGELRDMRSIVSAGYRPEPRAVQDLGIMARSSGDPDVRADYHDLKQTIAFMDSVETARPQDLRALLDGAKQSEAGVTPEQVDRLQLAARHLSKMETELAKDPLSWAARQGVVAVEPLDFEGDVPAQIKARRGSAQTTASYYGTEARYFTNEERDALSRYAEGSAAASLSLAGAMAGLDDVAALEMLGEVSKDAPLLASLGALMKSNGDAGLIQDAAAGAELRRSEGFVSRLPGKVDLEPIIGEAYGDAFAALPGAYAAARDTALAATEAEAFRRGVVPGEFIGDKTIQRALDQNFQKALGATYGADPLFGAQRRYGGKASVRGRDIIAPRWLRQDKVEDVLSRLTDADYAAAGGAGSPSDIDGNPLAADDLDGAFLVSIGDGRYRVSLTDPYEAGAQYVGTDNPESPLYILDMNAIEGRVRADKTMSKWTLGGGL